MILGNVCLKETNTLKLLFDYHCQNFHLCKHNGSRILQPNYFILQPVSPILFDVNGAIDPLSDEKGTGPARHFSYTELNGPQPKVRVYKILSQPRVIREILFCFDAIFSVL